MKGEERVISNRLLSLWLFKGIRCHNYNPVRQDKSFPRQHLITKKEVTVVKRVLVTSLILAVLFASCAGAAKVSLLPFNPQWTAADVAALIKTGADVNAEDDDGIRPVMFAILLGSSLETIRALIEAGADVNAETRDGITALMTAAAMSPQLLLRAVGADPMLSGIPERDWLLQKLAELEDMNEAVVEALIAAGADVNAKDVKGNTPLAWAVGLNSNLATT